MEQQNPQPNRTLIFVGIASLLLIYAAGVGVIVWSNFYNANRVIATITKPAGDEVVDVPLEPDEKFIGDKNAPVTLVEFADYQCPFCGEFYKDVFPKLKEKYIDTGKVKFYFQDFAFLGEESNFAAEAVRCAEAQGKYWEFHNYLYEHQDGENKGTFSMENLKKFGTTLGLTATDFNSCVDSRVNKALVESETYVGQRLKVQATPTVFINGKRVEGSAPFEYYAEMIEAELK